MTRLRGRGPARVGRAFGLAPLMLLCFALVASPRAASAAATALRGYDAPTAALAKNGPEAVVPPVPPEYLTEDLGWIEFAYHPSTRERVRPVIARAGAIRAELSALLGREALTLPVKIRVAALPAELDNLAPMELGSAVATTAASFGALRLAVMSAAPRLGLDPPDLESVFRHALAHLALDEATGGAPLPRWLHEGFAVHTAGDHVALRAQTLCVASLKAHLIALSDLETSPWDEGTQTSIAYAQAADFVRFLLEGDRRRSFASTLERLQAGASLDAALAGAYASSSGQLELAWRGNVARRYGFVPVLAGSLLVFGLLICGSLAVQRLRRAKPEPPAPRRRLRVDPEPRPRSSRPGAAQIVAARNARARSEGDGDAEVPKVEHNGQWHTLH